MTQRLISVGPNLPRPLCDRGTIHFHAAGCADLRRYPRQLVAEAEQFPHEFSSIKDAVLDIYDPECFCYDADDPAEYAGYRGDLYFAPCVKLPEVVA